MRIHLMNKKLYITTKRQIKQNDLYLDFLVHPNLVKYPLVMRCFMDNKKKIIQSYSGTTSPISCSRRILLIIG